MKNLYEQFSNSKRNTPIFIDDGNLLQNKGFKKKPLTINWTTIDKILLKHGILKEELYLLHEQIADSILIAKSLTREDSIVIFIKQWDNEGKEIMISIALDEKVGELDVFRVTSIYGRNNTESFIKRLYHENKILYFDINGGKWLEAIGVQLPSEMAAFDYVKNESYKYQVGFFIIEKN